MFRNREGEARLGLPLWLAIVLALTVPELAIVVFVITLASYWLVFVDTSSTR
jgi:hypothetical protein